MKRGRPNNNNINNYKNQNYTNPKYYKVAFRTVSKSIPSDSNKFKNITNFTKINSNPQIEKMKELFDILCNLQKYSLPQGFTNKPGEKFVFREVIERNGINYTTLNSSEIGGEERRNNNPRTANVTARVLNPSTKLVTVGA